MFQINSISVNGSEKLPDSPEPANVASLQAQMDELKGEQIRLHDD